MSDETARWALYKQFEEINQNFRTVWQLYLNFYTFLLTFNVAAIAFVYGKGPRPSALGWLTFAFGSIDILVALTSGFMIYYTISAGRNFQDVSVDIVDFARTQGESIDAAKCFRPTLPLTLALWAGAANALGMVLVAAVWIILWLSPPAVGSTV